MSDSQGFELSGWSEYKERVRGDLARIEQAQGELNRSIQEVRDSLSRKLDVFRSEEIERLRRELAETKERVSSLSIDTAAKLSALQVKASVWGGLAGAIPGAIAILWSVLKR